MLKQKIKNLNKYIKIASVVGLSLLLIGSTASLVSADQFDEQIKALQQQNAANQATANALAAQANSYQETVDRLEGQINILQQAIVSNQAKSRNLQEQVDLAQQDLDHQKKVLGENIKTMYLEGQISTLEILASSNNISDYVNKQAYRNSVQSKVKTAVDKINALKVQLQQQQRELEIAIKDQENQQAELNAAQAQQSEMLAYTAGQKAAYDQQIKSTNSQIASLKAQQAAANARLFAGSGGVTNRSQCGPNYPAYLCNRSMDTLVDAWGMYNRECVSYVAYMVDNDGIGGGMPYWGGRGHAWMWGFSGYMGYDKQHVYSNTGAWHTANALSDGIAYVSAGELQRGDVAVKDGPYGHVMYIESVNPNGTINISQFNHDLTGTYSEAFNVSTGGLVFLRF